MIEDLLYRIQSSADADTAEAAIARLPAEYRMVLELHYEWGLSRREISSLLGWSLGKVSQRLTRAISLVKYELRPEAFQKAQSLINRTM
jgi:RNA polymerase sigma factor (sigma-70 family)